MAFGRLTLAEDTALDVLLDPLCEREPRVEMAKLDEQQTQPTDRRIS